MPCEQAALRVACAPQPAAPGPTPAPSHPHKLPAPGGKIKAGSLFVIVIVPTFLPGALRCKGKNWVRFPLPKHFDPVFHIMHQSPQAEIKQVSAVSAPGLFPLFSMDF